jgi:hypothetical protein
VRDPLADDLITPDNAALLLIDYQPAQLAAVRSMDHALLLKNAVSTVKTIKTSGGPANDPMTGETERRIVQINGHLHRQTQAFRPKHDDDDRRTRRGRERVR